MFSISASARLRAAGRAPPCRPAVTAGASQLAFCSALALLGSRRVYVNVSAPTVTFGASFSISSAVLFIQAPLVAV
jgi:hypothetical protein